MSTRQITSLGGAEGGFARRSDPRRRERVPLDRHDAPRPPSPEGRGGGEGPRRRRAAAIGVVLGASACATAGGTAVSGGAGAGQPAPEIAVVDLDGKALTLRSLEGKVVLLDVWATWCEPCKQELPMLDQIARRLADRGVTVVAVSIDEERANVDRFLAERKGWKIRFAHDPKGAVAERLQPPKMPTSYVIDRAGVIRHVNAGFVPEDARMIEGQLADLAK